MTIDEFRERLQRLPQKLTEQDHDSLDQAGEIVADLARSRVPVRTGAMLMSIRARRLHQNVEQVFSDHPGARVNEQDARWKHPPRHWLTTSLIDSMPEIKNLFAEGIRDAIRAVIR